ncbi:hypothetical protein RvY_06273-2 [Ramazzottius varieornatus]|uniref:Thyrotropin-releasing hormone receptor n=1 Tax=Ramazzottius varieornatus TaxID=947166 RepID=A0A1D1UYJ0_RAMVA|nr:hypothetical protein RvY_06273-2 [Ramazzottius varieornatus]
MAAYTVERYIAVCRPLLAKQVCTLERTGRIIGCCWLAAALYCSPWFAMAQTHSDELSPELVQCQISVPASVYSIVFGTDLLLFYIVPLLIAIFAYWNIGRVMRSLPDRTASGRSQLSASSATSIRRKSASIRCFARRSHSGERLRAGGSGPRSIALISRTSIQSGITAQSTRPLSRRSVSQSLHILVATVLLFGVCWLPFRGLLVYNSVVEEPWLNLWYVLFTKCMIFLNCCVNPFLYTLLSKRFRSCFKTALKCAAR